MDPAQVCRTKGGTASWATLRSHGVTRTELRRSLEARHILRIARGVYAVPSARMAALHEAVWHGRATCVTALRAWGLPAPTVDARTHVAVHRSRSLSQTERDRSAVRLHWVDCELAHASTVIGALDVSSLCVSDMDQLAAVDAALNQRLITPADLERLSITPPSRAEWLRRHCDPECQSPPETFARVAMTEGGLAVRSQVPLPGVGRVDFVVDGSVVVEIDGQTYHMNERSFWDDRRRDRVAQLGGLVALRYTREDVERDLAGLVNEVGAAVGLERARSGRPALRLRPDRPEVPWVGARPWSRRVTR